jgi:hypothetical protein
LAAASPDSEDRAEYLHLSSGPQIRRPRGWSTSQFLDRFGDPRARPSPRKWNVKIIILRRLDM